MAISDAEWNEIYRAIEERLPRWEIVSGKVTRVNEGRMVVYCEKEFGDVPLIMVGYNYRVFYQDDSPKGTVGYALTDPPGNPYKDRRREALWGNSLWKNGYGEMKGLIPELPEIGEGVLVAFFYGKQERFGWVIGKSIGYIAV